MNDKPDVFDNRDGNTIAISLRQLLGLDSSDATVITDALPASCLCVFSSINHHLNLIMSNGGSNCSFPPGLGPPHF